MVLVVVKGFEVTRKKAWAAGSGCCAMKCVLVGLLHQHDAQLNLE